MTDELKPCPFCANAEDVAAAAWRKANLLGVELVEVRQEASRLEAEYANELERAMAEIDRLKAEVRELRGRLADGPPGEFEPRGWGMW